MKIELQNMNPEDIEKKSFEIISSELQGKKINSEHEAVIKRIIHTTADFEYVDTMHFSDNVISMAIEYLKNGIDIVTDTQMVKAGINKTELKKMGGDVHSFISDEDIIEYAKNNNTTRSSASIDKAARMNKKLIFAIGNAPTALIRLYELINENKITPAIIIGVPVGFVNVIESKELIMTTNIPYIVSKGRKGGSNVAASICNALIYQATNRQI